MSHTWPWAVLALLGAYHGLNPAMGWLFALALGLQEKRRSAVIGALFPIALGHASAIALAILLLRLPSTLPTHEYSEVERSCHSFHSRCISNIPGEASPQDAE